MAGDCCAKKRTRLILACSGGSNLGQAANQAAVELTREGHGDMYCLAGVGAGLAPFVRAVREADEVLAIDGCAVGCARAVAQQAGVLNLRTVIATDLGLVKVKDRALVVAPAEVESIKRAAQARPE